MIRFIASLVCFVALTGNVRGEPASSSEASEGQALAAELRAMVPEGNSEVRGVLKIRSPKQKITNNIPVIAKVVLCEDHWEAIYETAPTAKAGSEQLIVRRFRDKPNEYLYARAEAPSAPLPKPQQLTPEQADISLAGSDFSLTDLGLDFLHWPVQRRLKDEKRLDRSCYVLESSDPKRKGAITVKSSIDKESNGILIAEAYDADGKELKQFSLGGTSFRKVNGQWQLQRMEIRDRQRQSMTTLEFDRPPRSQ